MKLQTSEHTIHIAIISPQSAIDAVNLPTLREHLELAQEQGTTRFLLDLTEVPFMGSAAMGCFIWLFKRARQRGGDVKIVWPRNEQARRTLRLTRLDRIFDMAETPEEALRRGWH
jgi:anti-sigma B factor antagonist